MTKSNDHKKHYRMDKFGQMFRCQRAALNLKRSDKKASKQKTRAFLNKMQGCDVQP